MTTMRSANSYDSPATAAAAREEVTSMDEVQAALDQLVGRTLTAIGVREVDEGDAWELTLTAEGVEVVLVTQDADGYQSWLRLKS